MKNRIKSDKKTGYTERILVPVSNPVHVNELMDLAFYFHSHSELAIYPLTILNKIAGDEESMGIANALLEKAAQSPVPDKVHIEPVIASDINVAAGISKVVDQKNIDSTIIGWNRDPVKGSRIFSTILDQLLVLTSQFLIVSNTSKSILEHQRIVMAIPPESHREPGFEELISKTLNMAASAKLDLLILTEYSQAPRIKRSVENHGAELPVIVESVTLWEDLNLVLQNRVRKGDVILLNGARKETISWTHHSDQLPGSVSEQFPDNSLIVVYPRIKNRKFNSYFDP